ncbi:hypothetical protein KP509_09G005500 [Ceratopteris richardii]|uniref:Serine aminopeptidase S33 domain-containing protein n=1 Tax=Ceratopteris richardii TaxID=49495 RepID=A0A8T2U3P2_CERRI|nr:hypothetical protein KP509_09G005500 [Ceratopteris richardii]
MFAAPFQLPCTLFASAHSHRSSLTNNRRVLRAEMPSFALQGSGHASQAVQRKYSIPNSSGEILAGILEDSGSTDTVVLCHGFRSSKDSSTLTSIATRLINIGCSTFRFDFSGNGESDGEFQYGNYLKEVEDLRSVICHLIAKGHNVKALIGHSKGGNVVLLYSSKYGNIGTVVNLSGRFNLERGIRERLGERAIEIIEDQGFLEVKDRSGNVKYIVTKESLRERLDTDMKSAALAIPQNIQILTVHGSKDQIVDVEDAKEFDKYIKNHKLEIVEGGDHGFTEHREDLQVVIDFVRECIQQS